MSEFDTFFHKQKKLHIIQQKKYIKLNDFLKYLGHDKIQLIDINVLYFDGETFIDTDYAKELMKTQYNKNNPKVIEYHNHMGYTNMEYTIGAKTLSPIVTTVDKIGNTFKNVGSVIESSMAESKKSMSNVFQF